MKKTINFIFVTLFFLLHSPFAHSIIKNSVIISVGNLPITQLDLVKEMRLISILTNNKIDNSNKEQIKAIAVQALIKRKVKEIEVNKFNIHEYNKRDLENLISNAYQNIGTDENGLKNIMRKNNLNFNDLKKKFEVDLKWNTLIFQLYKNRIVLNMSEVEEKINSTIENIQEKRRYLLSEIEIEQKKEDEKIILDEIYKSISNEGFEKTAKKFSISDSSEYGGNIGWIEEKNLSGKIFQSIKDLKTDAVSKPIYLENTIVIIKKVGEKVFEKDIEKIKNRIVVQEKNKKLQMFSKSHFSNLEKIIQVNFL